MQTPSISIYAVAATFVALLPALLWYLSRGASESQAPVRNCSISSRKGRPFWKNKRPRLGRTTKARPCRLLENSRES